MNTTVKISKKTKKKLLGLDIADKGKTYDELINELIIKYKGNQESRQDELDRLLEWARCNGFKG